MTGVWYWFIGFAIAVGSIGLLLLWRRYQGVAKRRRDNPDEIYPLW